MGAIRDNFVDFISMAVKSEDFGLDAQHVLDAVVFLFSSLLLFSITSFSSNAFKTVRETSLLSECALSNIESFFDDVFAFEQTDTSLFILNDLHESACKIRLFFLDTRPVMMSFLDRSLTVAQIIKQ